MRNRKKRYSLALALILVLMGLATYYYQQYLKLSPQPDYKAAFLLPPPSEQDVTLVTINLLDSEPSKNSFNLQELRAFAIRLTLSSPEENGKSLLELEKIL